MGRGQVGIVSVRAGFSILPLLLQATPTTIQIELLLFAILRRVQPSLLLFLFNLISDRQLLIDVGHVLELEYGIDHKADPDWVQVTQLPRRPGFHYQPVPPEDISKPKPVLGTGVLDSKIIQQIDIGLVFGGGGDETICARIC